MTIALLFMAVVVSAILLVSFFISGPRYRGPVLPHFDGKRFINPGGFRAKGFPDLIRWMSSRKRGPWTPNTTSAFGDPPPSVVKEGVRITFINHSSFLIQVQGVNILTDPVWSERTSPFSWIGPKRMRRPGIRIEDLPRIDLVLLSHNHYDHLDIMTVVALHERFHPKFVQPLGVGKFLEEYGIASYTDLDWWTSISVNPDLSVEAVPAQHFSGRGMFDRDATLWCGYIISTPRGNIYFAGDTGYNNATFHEIGLKRRPLISIIPIGAYKPEWFMSPIHCSPAEAVQIHIDLGTRQSIASHFGTFPLADDGYDDPVIDLKKALLEKRVNEGAFAVLEEGKGRNFEF